VKVTEFLKGREAERQAVTRYINRHEEIFKGHTERVGKELELDSVAVEELDKVYPIPKPVTIINGVPQEEHIKVQNELIMSQKTINELQSRLLEAQEQIAIGKAQELLLEDKTKRISELEAKEQADKEKIAELQEELAAERSKSWLQKLLGK
jgi:hypothetical protein